MARMAECDYGACKRPSGLISSRFYLVRFVALLIAASSLAGELYV